MRRTEQARRIAAALLANDRSYGYQLTKQAHVPSGTLYPILDRFREDGWLDDGWETGAATNLGRPARRYYTVTDAGRQALTDLAGEKEVLAALFQRRQDELDETRKRNEAKIAALYAQQNAQIGRYDKVIQRKLREAGL